MALKRIYAGTEGYWYFLTAVVVKHANIFTNDNYFRIITDSLKYCQQVKALRVAGYVVMPNHMHLICAGSAQHPLSDTLRDFKRHTARKVIEEVNREQRRKYMAVFKAYARSIGKESVAKVWGEGNYPIILNSEQKLIQKLRYIHQNPVKKGFVEKPEHWKYSSARNYALGDHSILQVELVGVESLTLDPL